MSDENSTPASPDPADATTPDTAGVAAAGAGATPHGAEVPPGAHLPGAAAGPVPPGYEQYPSYGAYGEPPGSVRGDVKRLFRHRVVQLVGAGLIGFVIGGGAVATVGAVVWHHDHPGLHRHDRGGISQRWGGGFGPGSFDGPGSGNSSNGTSGSNNGSDNGGIRVNP